MLPGESPDPRRGAPRRALERWPLRDRDKVHARGPRPIAGASSTGSFSPRPRTTATRTASRRCWSCSTRTASRAASRSAARRSPRGRHGPPPQGGHPRGPGRFPKRESSADQDRRPARGCARARALEAPRRVPHCPRGALRDHDAPCPGGRGSARRWLAAAAPLIDGGLRAQPEGPPCDGRATMGEGETAADAEPAATSPALGPSTFINTPDADDERGDWTAEELEAEEQSQIEAVTAPPRLEAPGRCRPRRLCGAGAGSSSTRCRRSPSDHGTCPTPRHGGLIDWIRAQPLPGSSALRQAAQGRRRRSGTTAAF